VIFAILINLVIGVLTIRKVSQHGFVSRSFAFTLVSMIKRLLSLTMIGLMFNLVCNTSVVAKSKSREVEFAAKVKAAVARLGSGNHARIEVKLHDKRKLKGYVSQAGDDGFFVVDEKTGTTTHVAY
jgi:hypothetical protein